MLQSLSFSFAIFCASLYRRLEVIGTGLNKTVLEEKLFKKFQIPPLPTNYRSCTSPAISGVTAPSYQVDNRQLDVLKVIEKKPNSNLIDLNAFEQSEDKTNVRVSVLEAFDPLLIKTEIDDEAIAVARDGERIFIYERGCFRKYFLLIYYCCFMKHFLGFSRRRGIAA